MCMDSKTRWKRGTVKARSQIFYVDKHLIYDLLTQNQVVFEQVQILLSIWRFSQANKSTDQDCKLSQTVKMPRNTLNVHLTDFQASLLNCFQKIRLEISRVTPVEPEEPEKKELNWALIIGIAALVGVIILVIIIALIVCRRRKQYVFVVFFFNSHEQTFHDSESLRQENNDKEPETLAGNND